MERIINLQFKVRKYRHLRQTFRTLEAIATAVLITIFALAPDVSLLSIIGGLVAVVIIPEFFLVSHRYTLKESIKTKIQGWEQDFKFYYQMKAEYEELRNNFILKCHENFASEETKHLFWKEEMGTGWLSNKMKEFDSKITEANKMIEQLNSLKRLVIF